MDSAYLKPIQDDSGVQQIFVRRSKYGDPYIVIKAGFLLQAIIRPEDVINKAFTDALSALAYQCRRVLDQKDRVGELNTEDLPLLNETDPCTECMAAHPHCSMCCKVCEDPCNSGQDCRKDAE